MRKVTTACFFIFLSTLSLTLIGQKIDRRKPNIIIIYIDDLGYGDVSCYGATKVKTPAVDYLAENGLRFTDAHCTAATCTPSRFSLLTGRYAFRNNAAVLPGDAPLLIQPSMITLPAVLKQSGYSSAVIGKWHLGLGNGLINWNRDIRPGPLEVGFDYDYIIPATTDRVPTVFVENTRVVGLDPADPIEVSYLRKVGTEPTGLSNPELLKMGADSQHSNTITNGISRIGYMKGGTAARWKDEDIADTLISKAKRFIKDHKDQPFFLYFAMPDIHVPRAPHPRFVGVTPMGRRGDVIVEMDWMTGAIRSELTTLGIEENTLIIFTSDNGPVLNDGYADQAVERLGAHRPANGFRGGKYSAFEAGTRVPTIVYWPGTVKPGISKAVFSQIDIFASLAALTGAKIPPKAAPDSHNSLPDLLGQSHNGRLLLLEESYTLSLRKGKWKYIAPQQKGVPVWLKNKNIETGLSQSPQLYNLDNDPSERHNIADQNVEVTKAMQRDLMALIKEQGSGLKN